MLGVGHRSSIRGNVDHDMWTNLQRYAGHEHWGKDLLAYLGCLTVLAKQSLLPGYHHIAISGLATIQVEPHA